MKNLSRSVLAALFLLAIGPIWAAATDAPAVQTPSSQKDIEVALTGGVPMER